MMRALIIAYALMASALLYGCIKQGRWLLCFILCMALGMMWDAWKYESRRKSASQPSKEQS